MGIGTDYDSGLYQVLKGDMPPSSYIMQIPIEGPRTNNIRGLAHAVADKEGVVAWAKMLQWKPSHIDEETLRRRPLC